MPARKVAPVPEPWTREEPDYLSQPWLKPVLVATLILSAGFVWFIAHTISSDSTWGRIIEWLLYALAVMLLLGAIAVVPVGVYAAAQRARRVVVKSDGRHPMLYRHLDTPEATMMVMDRLTHSRVAEASRALPPGVQSVSQSQTTSTFDVVPEEPEPIALAPEALTKWSDVDRAGEFRPDVPPVVGWDVLASSLLRLDWKTQMGSIVVVGMSGSGKTTLALALAMQAVASGGKLIVCDRHAEDEEASLGARISPLAHAYLTPMAQSDEEVVDALKVAEDVLRSRIAGNKERWPLVVMVEELTSLMQRIGDDIEDILVQIGNEGRKFGVNGITFAQFGSKKDLGDFRDAASSTFVFRTRPDHARMALGYTPEVDIRQYKDGECFIQSRRDVFERVQTMWVDREDVDAFALKAIGGESLSSPKLVRPQLHLVAETGDNGMRWGISADDEDQFTAEEELRVLELYKLGKSPQQIVQAMRGVPPGGTRRYRKLKDAVEAIIRVRLLDAEG